MTVAVALLALVAVGDLSKRKMAAAHSPSTLFQYLKMYYAYAQAQLTGAGAGTGAGDGSLPNSKQKGTLCS